MKTLKSNKTNINKKIAIIIALIVLLAGGYAALAYVNNYWPFQKSTSVETTNSTTDLHDSTQGSKDDIDPSNSSDQTTDEIPVNDSISATITKLDQAGGFVTFSGTVNSSAANGKCTITFSNPNDKPVTRTVNATIEGVSSTCGPVQIPETEFSYLGTWTATFRYFANDTQVVATREITIK